MFCHAAEEKAARLEEMSCNASQHDTARVERLLAARRNEASGGKALTNAGGVAGAMLLVQKKASFCA